MSLFRSPLAVRALFVLAQVLLCAGAAVIVAGVVSPWASVTLFKNIDLALPGLLFAGGGLCLTVASLVLLGARRWPILCIVGAFFIFGWVRDGRVHVPERVMHQVVGADLALSPLNRLFDQFHIPNLQVGSYGVHNDQLLGPGLDWTQNGALLLLLGGIVGAPVDPVARWVYLRVARARCRACGARWPARRSADFCPSCGEPTHPRAPRVCPVCHAPGLRSDHHCIACGIALV